ncbi:hypothetical protein K474DRAFT_1714046 [Panus rudis PR-1116 ss-1]|nr:hypothetical protein K474DRAFT_1714046 [Panus rudis PR-1116 ss-1]
MVIVKELPNAPSPPDPEAPLEPPPPSYKHTLQQFEAVEGETALERSPVTQDDHDSIPHIDPPERTDTPEGHESPRSFTPEQSRPNLQLTPPTSLVLTQSQLELSARHRSSPDLGAKDKDKGKLSSWLFRRKSSGSAAQAKALVIDTIHDLLDGQSENAFATLDSCIEFCTMHGLSFPGLLQELSVEEHSLLYWAIIKGPQHQNGSNAGHDLVLTLLSLAGTLSDTAVLDVQDACLDASDGEYFQRLRRVPTFARLSEADRVLLGASIASDEVYVRDVVCDDGFAAWFSIPMFQKRLRVSKSVNVEFLTRGRIWQLKFILTTKSTSIGGKSYPKGRWLVSLSLLGHSPPTWVQARLVINKRLPVPSPGTLLAFPSDAYSIQPPKNPLAAELLMKTGMGEMKAPVSMSKPDSGTVLSAALDETAIGKSLQYENCPYVASDGTLIAGLEAKLVKTSECIIC